tara:strand:+ start:557 stop:2314 length:1758 start_codon:yes stop_codon:yes gene_type:complete
MAIEKTININVEDRDALKSINNIEAASKGAEKGVGGISKGFKGLGVAIKAAGIGIVIAALAKLGQVFSQNQKVADLFNTAFEAVSIAFNDFVNFAVKNTSGIIKFFDAIFKNPLESLKGFAKAFKENIQERFDSYLDTLGYLASAVKKVFSGDFAGALDDVKNAGKESLDVLTGVNDSFDKGKEFIEKTTESIKDYATETLNAAKENVNLANTAQLAAAQQTLLVEKYDRQAEQLRQIRDEERNSITERKKANDDLLEVLESQEKAMLATANAQLASAQAEAAKNNSIENQVAVTDALANRLGVLAQIEGFRSEQKANDLALDREQIELTNSKLESESTLSIERKRFNAEQIEDELARLEALKEIDLLEAEQETIRLEAIVENANAETQAKIDAQIALDEFTEQSRQTGIAREKEISEASIKISKGEADAKKANLSQVGNALGSLSEIAGKETKAGKALAISQALISTYQGATASYASLAPIPFVGPALGFAAAGAAVAGGLKQIKAIKKTKVPGGGGGGGATPSAPSAAPAPPSFNIVGASETSQLAGAIGDQTQQPVQAYVVANDVTSAQSLQNNIVEGATIG